MELQKSSLDLMSRLLKSSINTSSELAEISGQDKTTVTLVTVGLTLAVAGLLRAMTV